MENKKVLWIILILVFLFIISISLVNLKQEKEINTEKIKIITTLFPQYDFVKEIGKDKVAVSLLLPPGVEAHAYEPKPSDLAKINDAQMFVYTGEFMEPWAHDIIESTDKKVKVVNVSIGIKMMKENTHEEGHENETENNDNHHHPDGVDPHIWLDFENAKIMTENITKALVEVDPQNTEYYQNNFKLYQNKLNELDNEYKNSLSNCRSKKIIYGGHYAFGYLTKRYGFEYVSAQGFSPDSEPSAKDMISLVKQIKENNINYIFYEELTSPKIAETLAKETNTKLLLLNGAHNIAKENYEKNVSYISIMKENLYNLKIGLNCKN